MNAKVHSATYRGFFFSYDALVAGVIFALFLAIIFANWTSMRIALFARADEMMRSALVLSNVLLSPGNPIDWDPKNWQQIGLVDELRSVRLNATKVEYFRQLADPAGPTYAHLRESLTEGYEFAVIIGDVTIGNPPKNGREKISIVRSVIYANKLANMTVVIWA